MEAERIDIAIVGGGPAGLTAGLYACRGGADAVLFEQMFEGGQIVKTHRVDNYPGRNDNPDGYTLAAAMAEQAASFGLRKEYCAVDVIELTEEGKLLHTANGDFLAKAVILCPGARPRPLSVPGEEAFTGAGISYCATCDGAFYKGKEAAVIGGGDTALSDALYLSALCSKVYLIHRRDSFRGAESLVKAVKAKENVELLLSRRVIAFEGDKKLAALRLLDIKTNEETGLPVTGAFIAAGTLPETEPFKDLVPLADGGFIPVNERMETAVKGIFAAGDARVTPLRQVVTACADGAVAATAALDEIKGL